MYIYIYIYIYIFFQAAERQETTKLLRKRFPTIRLLRTEQTLQDIEITYIYVYMYMYIYIYAYVVVHI